jgi:hypothetical protein
MAEPGFWYLVSPYSSDDPNIRRRRYEQALSATAILMQRGYAVFSPLSHSIPLTDPRFELPQYTEFWLGTDLPILEASRGVVLLKLDGWDKSAGVTAELIHADRCGLPVIEYTQFLRGEAQ